MVRPPVSQKVVNRTISDLSYDHLPTKFATVSQNLSEFYFTISDLRLVVMTSSLYAEIRKSINLIGQCTYQINSYMRSNKILNIVILLVYIDTQY